MDQLLVIDTHTLVWFLTDNPKLSFAAWSAMEAPGTTLCISAIAVAELYMLVEKSKVGITADELRRLFEFDDRLSVVPVDFDTVQRAALLTELPDIHDRLIVATAQQLVADGLADALVTADRRIAGLQAVPVLW